MFKHHNPATIAPAVGHYSHALEVPAGARLLFISGQVPERPDGTVPAGFEAQCEAAWANALAALAAAGMGPEHLVKVTTFLTDPDQAEPNSRIRQAILGPARPALTVVVARTLSSPWLLEIEAVAASPAAT
ncbi:MAG: RidA family protein [Gemmatimonadales bacterium]